MRKSIWRVEWDIDGGKGPHTSFEFGCEENAMGWSDGIVAAGGKNVVVTELIVGKVIRCDGDKTLF